MKLLSPAKVNLFLTVLKRRVDGYHNLHTLFERVDLCDKITITKTACRISVRTNVPDLPNDSRNIATRAAELLKKYARVREGARIRIQKRIPIAAGLGGGSSNAATVLLGLNRLWRLRLSKTRLLKLAAKLGSDVPFFILETPFAEGRGRGEILKPIRLKGAKLWHVIVKPPFGISTKHAYQVFDKFANLNQRVRLTPKKPDVKMPLRSLKKGASGQLSKHLTNSLEVTENKKLIDIFSLKKRLLSAGALASLMSGSGSAVFGVFQNRQTAEAAAKILRENKRYQVFVARTF